MVPVDGNMDSLTQAVLSEARTEADQVIANAREKADGIHKRAEQEAENERKEILERARQDAERLHRQAIATAHIQARTQQLENREKLLEKVFTAAQQQLPSVQQWSDYDKLVRHLLKEAIQRLGAPLVLVQADPTTLQCLTKEVQDQIAKELHVELRMKEPLKQGIGVIVETEDGRRRYDNTLGTRLNRMQDALRNPVYHILMGESL